MKRIEAFQAGTYRNQGEFKSFITSRTKDTWIWENTHLNILLSEANRELGGLNNYAELIPDIDLYIRMNIRTEANKSSRIEGTRTTIVEDMMNSRQYRTEYYDALQRSRTQNDLPGRVAFFLAASIETVKSAKGKFRNEVK